MISVVINILNEAEAIGRALKSIFDQRSCDIEVIVVDDGSTDNLDDALKVWRDRITLIRFDQNKGRQVARNAGIAAARGQYLFVCDADIVLESDCFKKMLAALSERPECSYAYSGYRFGSKVYTSFPFDQKTLRNANYINTASLVKRSDHPGFDESIEKFQDWDVWLTMLENGYIGAYIPEILFSFRSPTRAGALSAPYPLWMYRIPWCLFGIRIQKIDDYHRWRKIIQTKHGIVAEKRRER